KVRRAKKIKVRAFDLQGQPVELEAEDLLSRAIQHETDHPSGRLFVDFLGPLSRHTLAGKLREMETKYRQAQLAGEYPADAVILRELDSLTTIPELAAREETARESRNGDPSAAHEPGEAAAAAERVSADD